MNMVCLWRSCIFLLCFVYSVHAAAVDAQCPNGKKMKDCSGYNDFCKTMICLRYYSQEIICKSDPCLKSCIPRFYLKSTGRMLRHSECGGFS